MHGTTEQTFDKRFIGFFHVCFARFERAIQPPILDLHCTWWRLHDSCNKINSGLNFLLAWRINITRQKKERATIKFYCFFFYINAVYMCVLMLLLIKNTFLTLFSYNFFIILNVFYTYVHSWYCMSKGNFSSSTKWIILLKIARYRYHTVVRVFLDIFHPILNLFESSQILWLYSIILGYYHLYTYMKIWDDKFFFIRFWRYW